VEKNGKIDMNSLHLEFGSKTDHIRAVANHGSDKDFNLQVIMIGHKHGMVVNLNNGEGPAIYFVGPNEDCFAYGSYSEKYLAAWKASQTDGRAGLLSKLEKPVLASGG